MYKKIRRTDGSVVIFVPRSESKSVTWEVMFKVGSRQERRRTNGISHFVEHMMFKGTRRRPNTKILSRELDAVGAEYNAFTGKDHTGYYVMADMRHSELGIDILSDMLQHSLLDKREMLREKGVILEELKMYRDNPMMRIDELFEGVMFSGSALGWEIGGPLDTIRTLRHKDILSFRKKFYYPGNMIIGCAGNFKEREALKLIDRYFPPRSLRPKARVVKHRFSVSYPSAVVEEKDTEQIQMMMGFPGFGAKHDDADALMLLSVILGGTMSSRLFIAIRERKGLAYVIRSSSQEYEDTGYFAVHAGLDKTRINEALKAIRAELERAAKNGVTKSEFLRAKDNIAGRLTLRFENPSAYLTYLLSQELLLGTVEDLSQRLRKIDRVKLDDVNRVARKVIDWKKIRLALIGPYKRSEPFMKILQSRT